MERTSADRDKEKESSSDRQHDAERESNSSNDRSELIAPLHQTEGNQTVQRLYESGEIQAALSVSQPGDPKEREAEQVAEQVMRIAGAEQVSDSPDRVEVSRKAMSGGSTVEGKAKDQIESIKGGGKPLSPSTRSYFEPRFGRDFSDVRVHTGQQADKAARSINAEAFTHGTDVVFRSGAYDPDSDRGRGLIAHELAHVVQQGAAALVRESHGKKSGDIPPLVKNINRTSEGLRSVQRQVTKGTGGQQSATRKSEEGSQQRGGEEEYYHTFEYKGTTYHVSASDWDPFVAQQLESIKTNVIPKLRGRKVGARAMWNYFRKENNETNIQWVVSWIVEGWMDLPPESVIIAAEKAFADVEEAAKGSGERGLQNTINAIKRAEPIINKAANRMNRYQEEMIENAQFALTTAQYTKMGSFMLGTAIATYTLTPAGASALQQGVILAGTSATSSGIEETAMESGEAMAQGWEEFDSTEIGSEMATSGVAGFLGGTAGAAFINSISGPLATQLNQKASREITEEMVKKALRGSAKRMLRDVIESTWEEGLSTEEFRDIVIKELIRRGLLELAKAATTG